MADEDKPKTAEEHQSELYALLQKPPRSGDGGPLDRMTLYDAKGKPKNLPRIVAQEILQAQISRKVAPEHRRYIDPSGPASSSAQAPIVESEPSAAEALDAAALGTEAKTDEYLCDSCERTFKTAPGLSRHVTAMHDGEE